MSNNGGYFSGERFEQLLEGKSPLRPSEGTKMAAERKGYKDSEPKEDKAGEKKGMDRAPEDGAMKKDGKKHGRHHSRKSSRR